MSLALLAVLVGAVVQSATGFGFALVASPALFAALDPGEAVISSLGLSLVLNVLLLFGEGRGREIQGPEGARLGAGAVPGVLLGLLVLRTLGKPALQVLVGVVVIGAGLVQARGTRRVRRRARASGGLAVGLVAGTLTTSTGVNGPPVALWLHARGLVGGTLRDSCTAVLMGLALLGAGALAISGSLTLPALSLPWVLALVAAAALGHYVGREAFVRLGVRGHVRIVLLLALVAGTASTVAGARALA